jgi:hypothetical protein
MMRRPYNDKDKQIGRGSKSLGSGGSSGEDGGGEREASRAEEWEEKNVSKKR